MIKKVCIISPSLQMGGIERSLSTLANYLNSVGIEVHFLTLFPFDKFFRLDDGVLLYESTLAFSKKEQSKIGNITYYIAMLSPFNGNMVNKINSIRPDILISYGDWFPHLIMLGLRNKYPFIYSNRSNPNIRYSKPIEFIRWLTYKLTPPCGIIAQTSHAKIRKKKIFGDKVLIKIIPNPITPFEMPLCDKENWVVSVGRLHKEKGFIRLIEAFSNIENKNWKLVLVGDGIHKKEIADFVNQKGIQNRVIFAGKVREVTSILSRSKIFVLASHNEGFPNALLEACSVGLPTISFDIVAGPSDIIENEKNGILLKDGDIEGLTKSIDRLIDDEELRDRLGANARFSTKRYEMDQIGKELYVFMNEVVDKWRNNL